MQKRVPSLFAQHAHPRMSERYSFTNTYEIISNMFDKGWRVTSVQGGEKMYKKVMVRMRHKDYMDTTALTYAPELLILDAHDGSSRLKSLLGAIKFACMNGIIAGDFLYARSYMHYAQDLMAQIKLDLDDIQVHIEQLHKRVAAMCAHRTTNAERMLLADSAIKVRWGKEKDGDFVATVRDKMLRMRRNEDDSDDLFTAMNIVQENILRGGGSYVVNDRMQRIRPITQVDRNVHINQALWLCAEQILAGKYRSTNDASA